MYGLLGRTLGHSRSPMIHGMLHGEPYLLLERQEEELEEFFAEKAFQGINVTVPYKEKAARFCQELSPVAHRIGAVNTVVKREDGSLYGHNTDYDGFLATVRQSGLPVAGKKCLVLGSGGGSKMAVAVLEDLGAGEIVVISRSGKNHYGNLDRHGDCDLLVNTTPVGMYPNCEEAPLSIKVFPQLQGVFDLIYNPCRTKLLREAEKEGIPGYNGLYMLVCQAISAAECFFSKSIGYDRAQEICDAVAKTL